jgi:hypothetical protein
MLCRELMLAAYMEHMQIPLYAVHFYRLHEPRLPLCVICCGQLNSYVTVAVPATHYHGGQRALDRAALLALVKAMICSVS